MKPFVACVAAAAALLFACSKGDRFADKGEPVSSAPASAATGVAVQPMRFAHRKLANGLDVYSMPDPSTANVSVQVWYRVGSKDDPKGRSGFAHLFEHIMFKATRNMPNEFFDRLTEDVGGFNNASTYDDFTNYYEVVPANHLERILWAEAERMGSLVVDEAVFSSERNVVKEELRQRVLAEPYGRLFYLYLNQANFAVHPYGRPGIGSIEDLDAATVDDVRAFHSAWYRPDNAVLVVAGNFDQQEFDRWVDKYFGALRTPNRPIQRIDVKEPPRVAKTLTTYAPNVPLPAVAVSYPLFAASSPDYPALLVLDAILTRGDSSRFYQSLVYRQQIASEAFSFSEATRDPSIYTVAVILSEGRTADEGLAALKAEVAKLAGAPPTEAELEEAKNELVTARLEERETAFGRAFELADSVMRYDDPSAGDRILAAIQNTTAADVQRVAKTVFDDSKSVAIKYLNEDMAPAGAKGDVIETSPAIEAGPLPVAAADAPVFALASYSAREGPPPPGPPVSPRIPETRERTLANGLRVIVATRDALPLVSANLRFGAGSASDPGDLAGVADLTATLVTKGTTTRSATDIAQQVERLGASLSANAGADSSAVSLFTRADRRDEAFALLADVTRNPVFDEAELDRERQQALDDLSVAMSNPGQIAARVMTRLLYGAAPYGGVATERSLEAITRAAARDFHLKYWRPENGVLVIAGAVSADEGFALAEKHFGGWAPGPNPLAVASTAAPPPPPAETRTVVVDLPDSGQAAVAFGLRTLERTHTDYYPALLATTVLGGGYSARLNAEIRIKRGLSYGAGASLAARKNAAPLIARTQTKNESASLVVDLIAAEFARLGAEPASPAELAARKATLIGDFGREIETISGLGDEISSLALFRLPPEKLKSYAADIDGVGADATMASARTWLAPQKASIVVVGDASVFWDEFSRKHPSAERLPLEALDLDKAGLK